MASDLSSVCTETNEILDDEKEEGEISLEDVSSSEDGPPYKYQPPRTFGQCLHCFSTGHCATWCRTLILNKKIFVQDAGKENRRHHHHHRHSHQQRAQPPASLLSGDLQPISSDEDLELLDLAKKKKARKKKRRKKSPSFSLSPSPVNMAIKESIHRGSTRRHQSPVKWKAQLQQQSYKSPPPRKLSPQRIKKLKKPISGPLPLQSRVTVSKLLKKVKKLEPYSVRGKEARSSLKDKLSNIIGGKKSDEEETQTVLLKPKDKSSEVEKRKVTKNQSLVVEEKKKQDIFIEEEKKEVTDKGKTKENGEDLAKVTLTLKPEFTIKESSEVSQPTQPARTIEEKRPQEPDEDLQLRVIALRSAVMKKHRTRIARMKKQQQLLQQKEDTLSNEPIPRIESPFTSSFNKDFPLLAEMCSPGSPLDPNKDDIYCPEDMELDSDMELDKEVSMVVNATEKENNILDGDSPYSPTDDLGSPQGMIDQPMDLSMYTASKPIETSMHISHNNNKNDALDGTTLELRPYSPSDATVYDPELPGVLGANANIVPTPLQPPPLPPLGMISMMPLNPMNLLSTYPIVPISSFAPVNPMLTAPFIPFTPTTMTTTVAPTSTATQLIEEFETDLDGSPLVPIEPKDTPNWKFIGEPLYLPEINTPPLPGLVPAPILKCNKQLQRIPSARKSSENLFRNADMKPVTVEDENKISGAMFKPIKLSALLKKAVTTQPAAAFNTTVEGPTESQKQICSELEQDLRELEELEEQENKRRQEMEEKKKQEQREAEERKRQEQRETEELEKRKKQEQRELEEKRRHEKEEVERRRKRERDEAERRRRIRETPIRRLRKKSVTPAPRARRRSSRTPSRGREIYRYKSSRSSRDSEGRSKSKKTEDSKENLDEKTRKLSIDDDEQALREILLASLAKRKPNAKRKAALEAAKKKTALETAKATSDKENIANKSAEICSAVSEVDKIKETATIDKTKIVNTPRNISPSNSANVIPLPSADLSVVSMPTVLQEQQRPTLKRLASALLPFEQPARKVVRKLNVIPASTRAVNNAIRYQNLLIQRKLVTRQKRALYNTRFAVNNSQLSESPEIVQSPSATSRFVISLNEDTESESEANDKKENFTKTKPASVIPKVDFEKSVDQFLKVVRLQQELSATTTSVTISKPATPPIVSKAPSNMIIKNITTATDVISAVANVTPSAAITKVAASVTTSAVTTKVAPSVTTSAAITMVAITPSAKTVVPKVVTTAATTSLSKERIVLKMPKPKTPTNVLSIPATPQAVKHLPVPQQEEYRRLKQQLYEYEQLRLQKVNGSTITITTTSQAQSATAKPVNTLSSLTTPSISPSVQATSTPKAPLAKLMPKKQLIAAISPISKLNNVTPVVVTPTKIVHATTNVITKTVAPTINSASKVASISTVETPSSKSVIAKVTQPDPSQLKLLSKITESLNSQKTLLNTAANKISSISSKSLKVLTKEQINQKTSKIQQKNNCVVMDDLNKTGQNNMTEKKENIKEVKLKKENESDNKIKEVDDTKEIIKEESLSVTKSKNEDKLKENWDDFKKVVNNEVQTLSNLSTEQQKELLTYTEAKLILRRHTVLDDITVMSGSLRQWEIERDLTSIISAEIIDLREKLRIAEFKLQDQKNKLRKIQPRVTFYHEKINTGRKECFRLSKICNGLGQQIIGSSYKVPTVGAELLNNRIKEVATHTQKLRGKTVQNNAIKTGRSLKSNPKANTNPNSNVEKLHKKQNNTVDTKVNKSDSFSKRLSIERKKIINNSASSVVFNKAQTENSKNNFKKQNYNQSMDIDKETSSIKVKSMKKLQSTNANNDRDQNVNSKQSANSEKVFEKVQELQSTVASSVTVNNNVISSMEMDIQSYSNTANETSDKNVGTNRESIFKVVNNDNGTVTSNVDQSIKSVIDGESNIIKQTVQNNSKALNMEIESSKLIIITGNEPASYNSEQLPAVQIAQSTDATENSIETNYQKQLEKATTNITETTVQSNVPTKSENITNEVQTSNPISNAAEDGRGNIKIEITNVNMINEIRMIKHSTNPGPTSAITNNIESVSVNNNTNSVVNTSLDDYMKEMTVSVDYNMCSKNCKSSTSATSNEHSTTFDEEIRLLELASESDALHELTNDCQSIAIADHGTNNNYQSTAKAEHDDCKSEVEAQQETIDNCLTITRLERDFMNNYRSSSSMKTERHVTDNTAIQSLSKNISKKTFRPYESILKLVRAPRNVKTDGILCPFALMGTCIDDECRYIHQPTSHCR
ncbi:uncharacterized protein LOC131672621 isoform X2 [Phymastichus coffea]|uniref:uncharacterized protein LOC131672621 isoform X2 n=1 Tax=Phymastichus coffea TaxID=108790 RepID=UPI00273BA31F|nr:uncharacterized protein LOC131672621 isoform X2 [Phymastichus coffea]